MADKDEKNKEDERFDPKPVQLGGESIVDRLLPHKKKILITIGIGFAVYGAIAIVIHFRDAAKEKQTSELAAVLDVAQRPVKSPTAPEPADKTKVKEQPFANDQERANAVLSELAKQGTDAAGPSYRGAQLVTAGKLDEAIAEYRKGTKELGMDGVLAREGLGLALEQKATGKDVAPDARQKGLEEALAAFQSMQPDDKGPGRAYALYHQGRILYLLNKKDEAKAAFQKAKDLSKDKDADLAELLDERLAMLGA